MLEDALLDLSNRSDIVVDPFLGSGSTLIAADKTGLVCRGVELDPLCIHVIVRLKGARRATAIFGWPEPRWSIASRLPGRPGRAIAPPFCASPSRRWPRRSVSRRGVAALGLERESDRVG